jgi:hypothetical protein
MLTIPPLPERLQGLCDSEYPRFSDFEMQRRRRLIGETLVEVGCDHLVFCGANRFGSVVQWLSQWPVTAEAVGVFTPRALRSIRQSRRTGRHRRAGRGRRMGRAVIDRLRA